MIPFPEEDAISFKVLAKPPLVGSLNTFILSETSNISATIPFKGAVSLSIFVSNSNPALKDIMLIP